MWPYAYVWETETDRWFDKFGADKPVVQNTVLFDLLNGVKYFVEEIRPNPRAGLKPIMRTRSAGILNEERLSKLRIRADYTPTEFSLPLDDIVFFTDASELLDIFA